MLLRRHRWAMLTAALLVVYGAATCGLSRGHFLASFGDITQLLLVVLATALMVANALSTQGQTRFFWLLMAAGCVLWTANLAMWVFFEVILRRNVPEPFLGDVILFIHVVPFMAAVALCPHRPQEEKKLHFSTLNFLMLLIWWVFLYAFVVFPDEYVRLNVGVYSHNYDVLYLVENIVFLVTLALLTARAQGGWKRVYWNLFLAMGLYMLSSQTVNAAISRGQYYSGSWYDIPFVASICWMIFAGLLARELKPVCDSTPPQPSRWLALSPRMAMVAILSLPILACWSEFIDTAPTPIRRFRLLASLAAMLVLGVFVFWRQYLLDHELMRLLDESHRSFENLKHLQTQLVQKEKLASLGQLVAGAAHEINNPLTAILGYSELLAENRNLDSAQVTMAQKIGQQARRTRDLVSGLLSFAQQAPAEKTLVDLRQVVQRALQMKVLQLETKGIRVENDIAATLPPIWGNFNQLMRCCLEIIGNAMDALEQTSGGTLWIKVRGAGDEIILEFADSGPGILEPKRVFDPFYTTKEIGKGTGLGLSSTYGVVQDHRGQIICHNRREGGAVFLLRFPIAESDDPARSNVLASTSSR
ncbi:MAG: HAMP domain-containing sensor histidine kinase [Terriglobales bacterium]